MYIELATRICGCACGCTATYHDTGEWRKLPTRPDVG